MPRGAGYEDRLGEVLEAICDKGGYEQDFENEVFEVHPYYWGDCTCGADDALAAWESSHDHTPSCYQAEYAALPKDKKRPYTKPTKLVMALCERRGIPYNDGISSAVHCDCGFREDYAKAAEANPHDERCPIVRPNFRHKSSGLTVMWYKYPLRDSYASREIGLPEWRRIMQECLDSLKVAPC